MKQLLSLLIAIFQLVIAYSVVSAQSSQDIDGLVVVPPAGGSLSYSYPLSNNSVDGYPVTISLNYSGNVQYTAHTNYYVYRNTDADKCKATMTGWEASTKTQPSWLLSVNGFAVQVLQHSPVTIGNNHHIPLMLSGYLDGDETQTVIPGYDYCASFRKLVTAQDQDEIQLLKGDGSILSMKNIEPLKKDGYYYEDGANSSVFAYVTYKTNVPFQSDTKRILNLYDGSGLEYIFEEEFATQDIGYTLYPAMGSVPDDCICFYYSNPTILPSRFYLRKINSDMGKIIDLAYEPLLQPSPAETDVIDRNEKFISRRPVYRIGNARISYSDGSMTVQDLDRTYNVLLGTRTLYWYDDVTNQPAIRYNDVTNQSCLVKSCLRQYFNYPGSPSSQEVSVVNKIIDPEGREIRFAYDAKLVISKDRNFSPNNQYVYDVINGLFFLKSISTPKSIIEFEYQASDNTTGPYPTIDMANYTVKDPDGLMKVSKVTTYNAKAYSKLETAASQSFVYNFGVSNPNALISTVETIKDERSGQTIVNKYTYDTLTAPAKYINNTVQPYYTPDVKYTYLKKLSVKTDNIVKDIEYTHGNAYVYFSGSPITFVPLQEVTKVTEITPGTQGGDPTLRTTTNSVVNFTYSFESVMDFGGYGSAGEYFGKRLKTGTKSYYRPDNGALLYSETSTFRNLPLVLEYPVNRTDSILDVAASKKATQAHREQTGDNQEILCFQQQLTPTTNLPPIWGIPESKKTKDATGKILSGVENVICTTLTVTPPAVSPAMRRGSIMSDKIYGYDMTTPRDNNTYKYRGGWYRNQLTEVKNSTGQISRVYNNYLDIAALNNQMPTGKKMLNNGNTSTYTMGNIEPLFERPVASEQIVRKHDLSGSNPVKEYPIRTYLEKTYFGEVSGVFDANGWYTQAEYDHNGRTAVIREPYDFPGSGEVFTIDELNKGGSCVPLYHSYTERVAVTHVYHVNTNQLPVQINSQVLQDDKTLMVGNQYMFSFSADSINPVDTIVSTNCVTHLIYHPDAHNILNTKQNITGLYLKLNYDGLTRSECQTVNVAINQFKFSKTHVFGCPAVDLLPGRCDIQSIPNSKLLMIDISNLKDSLLSTQEPVDIEITMTSYTGNMEILNRSDDVAPCIWTVYNGDPTEAPDDFTYKFKYDEPNRKSTIYRKVDDPNYTANALPLNKPLSECFGRYSRVINDHGILDMVIKTDDGKMIGELSPKTDISRVVTGFGKVTSVTDQALNVCTYSYRPDGSLDQLTNPDNTTTGSATVFGTPAYVLANIMGDNYVNTEEYYGFCFARKTTDEEGIVSATVFDALGRKRMTVFDLAGLKEAVKYKYDLSGNLIEQKNQAGDIYSYQYDEFGRLKRKYNPVSDWESYRYDKSGRLRFSQTRDQADKNMMSFNQYDDLGRVTVTGEAKIDVTGLGLAEPTNRLTDAVDPDVLHHPYYNITPNDNVLTVNTTVLRLPPVPYPMPIFSSVNTISNTPGTLPVDFPTGPGILPERLYTLFGTSVPEHQVCAPYLKHDVNYFIENQAISTTGNFEDASGPQVKNVLSATSYDEMPPKQGLVWENMPDPALLARLTKTGTFRNQNGRPAAVAYRTIGDQPFHYIFFDYDARGRVSSMIRYTENLGFDAVYYWYNSANKVIKSKTVDPMRQFMEWYDYDDNGALTGTYVALGNVNSGFGVDLATMAYPATNLTKPAIKDASYEYDQRRMLKKIDYLSSISVNYDYSNRGWLNSVTAMDGTVIKYKLNNNSSDKEADNRDKKGIIKKQVFTRCDGSNYIYEYAYDENHKNQLKTWTETTWSGEPETDLNKVVSVCNYTYDDVEVGNPTNFGVGNITHFGNHTYTYEPANKYQLKNIAVDGTSSICGFTYDHSGRMVMQGPGLLNLKYNIYAYTGSGLLKQLNVATNTTPVLTRDENGNIINSDVGEPNLDGINSYQYEWHYRYSPLGGREQKRLYYSPVGDNCGQDQHAWNYNLIGAGGEIKAVYHGRQRAIIPYASNRFVYMYAVEYRAGTIAVKPNGAAEGIKEYNVTDNNGSLLFTIRTNYNGTVREMEDYKYEPYGADRGALKPKHEGFAGGTNDWESGLIEMGARMYNPAIGRFITPDPLLDLLPAITPYQYAFNSPVNFSDPSGLFPESEKIGSPKIQDGGEEEHQGGTLAMTYVYANRISVFEQLMYKVMKVEGAEIYLPLILNPRVNDMPSMWELYGTPGHLTASYGEDDRLGCIKMGVQESRGPTPFGISHFGVPFSESASITPPGGYVISGQVMGLIDRTGASLALLNGGLHTVGFFGSLSVYYDVNNLSDYRRCSNVLNNFTNTNGLPQEMLQRLRYSPTPVQIIFTNKCASAHFRDPDKSRVYINIDQSLPAKEAGFPTDILAHELGHAIRRIEGKSIDRGILNAYGVPWEEVETVLEFENPARNVFQEYGGSSREDYGYPEERKYYNGNRISFDGLYIYRK